MLFRSAFDGPGHGRSGHSFTNVYDFGDCLKTLIQQLGEVDVMLAHSFGVAATLFMLGANQNLSPEKIVCYSPMSHMKIHLSIFQTLSGSTNATMRQIESKIQRRLGAFVPDWHVLGVPEKLPCKGIVFHDTSDPIVPFYWGIALAASWSNANFVPTNKLGHNRILQDQAVIEKTVQFLRL